MKAKYQHDCEACIFLGRDERTDSDLYIHLKGSRLTPSFLARYADDPPNYLSGCDPRPGSPLGTARDLAVRKGLISEKGEPRMVPPPSRLGDVPDDLRKAITVFDTIYYAVMKVGAQEDSVLELVKEELLPRVLREPGDPDTRLLRAFTIFIDECIEENRDDS